MDKTKLDSLLISPSMTIKQVMQKFSETLEKRLFVIKEIIKTFDLSNILKKEFYDIPDSY